MIFVVSTVHDIRWWSCQWVRTDLVVAEALAWLVAYLSGVISPSSNFSCPRMKETLKYHASLIVGS